MKKIAIIVAVLIIAVFFANTAFAKFVDSSDNQGTAKSGSIDVKIVERSKDCGCTQESSSEVIDAVSSIKETLDKLKPGDKVVLSYKIVNNGCIDVLLEGINVTVDNSELISYLNLKWTLTQYTDGQMIKSTSNSSSGQSLQSAAGRSNVSFEDIVINSGSTKNYCIMELEITFDDIDHALSDTQTVFTITPSFIQN